MLLRKLFRKLLQGIVGQFVVFSLLFAPMGFVYGEGTWQLGLSEGASHEQPLFEYDNNFNNDATGLEPYPRPLYVDILSDTEVINISLCGTQNTDDIRIEVWDEAGTTQLNTTYTNTGSNITCNNDLTGTLGTPYQFTPGSADTYQLRFFNDSGNGGAGVFRRFDVTVTPDVSTPVDPQLNQGRLWGYRWAFICLGGIVPNQDCYGDESSISSNLYAVVDGGFDDSYYVWQLDLDHFAGYAYELVANAIGLNSPNPDGVVVAGLSACIDTDDDPSDGCGAVSGNRNNVTPAYKIYSSDPAVSYPRPSTAPEISDFRFLNMAGVDDSI